MEVIQMRGRRISDKTKIKKGLGKGHGKKYSPMFTAWEISSRGKKVRVMGLKTNREHLLLSTLEQDYLYYVDFTKPNQVVDIREQFPLDLVVTQGLCNELGIRHIVGKDNKITHYTTDFLLTMANGEYLARTCKYRKELNEKEKEIKEKFTIEREYYRRLGIDWKIVREIDFDRIRAKNIGSCYKARTLSRFDDRLADYDFYESCVYTLLGMLLNYPDRTLGEIVRQYEEAVELKGNGLNILKNMIINKVIKIDMKKFIVLEEPLTIDTYQDDLQKHLKKQWEWNKQLMSEKQIRIY